MKRWKLSFIGAAINFFAASLFIWMPGELNFFIVAFLVVVNIIFGALNTYNAISNYPDA